RVNVALFQSIDYILSLAEHAESIVLISSISSASLPETLKSIKKLRLITVPTHHRTTGNGSYHTAERSFPYVYDNLAEDFILGVGPGTLVLVAAGVIGKIFIGQARERGAVALDIGGVVDDWISAAMSTSR